MEIGEILSSDSDQGKIVRELIKRLLGTVFQTLSGDDVVFEQSNNHTLSFIQVSKDGSTVTWKEEAIPPVVFGEITEPNIKQAKGNNPKQIALNAIKQHKENQAL